MMTEMSVTLPYMLSLGFTESMAEKLIIKHPDILEILRLQPKKLSYLLDTKEIEQARASDAKQRYATDLFALLSPFKFKDVEIMKIFDSYESEEEAIRQVKKDPYALCRKNGASFSSADKLALSLGEKPESKKRMAAAILEVLDNCSHLRDNRLESLSGSMCVDLETLQKYICMLLEIHKSDDDEEASNFPIVAFEAASASLFANNEIHISYRKGKSPVYYSRHLADIEYSIAKNIKERLDNPPAPIDNLSRLIERAEAELNILLSDEQMDAVRMAITSPISVITGGPGTGKTSVQKILIETFEWATKCKPLRLIAPTGQAAKRMTESTGKPATTLHKALGLMAGETEKVLDEPLSEELIIADEASMIDAELFNLLLQNTTINTRIVVVGDINQLPSIGAGSVLRELILAKRVPTTNLTKIFRQADDSPIAYNSARINTGEKALIENDSFQIVDAGGQKNLADTVTAEYVKAVNEVGIDNVICLSAYRRSTTTGVNALNQILRAAIRPEIEKMPHVTIYGVKYYVGDKIVYGKNKNGLVNGDLGYITEILGPRSIKARFGEKEAILKNADIENIDLAYAQTVHKAQGAEFKTAVMVLNAKHRNLSRALFFTGITRAKAKCICVCDSRDTVNLAVNDSGLERSSRLRWLI